MTQMEERSTHSRQGIDERGQAVSQGEHDVGVER
jgi:hypothetical protein